MRRGGMNESVKKYAARIAVLLVVGNAIYLLGTKLYNDRATISTMEKRLGEADANNQRLTARNSQLERINNQLTGELANANKYSSQLEGHLAEIQRLAGAIGEFNRAATARLNESAAINKRTEILIGEVGKTGK